MAAPDPSTLHEASFVCVDCDSDVFLFPPTTPIPEDHRCATCAWLVEFVPDEAERKAIRARSLGF